MAKLFIPTRNRPTSLSKVLEYLHIFYPSTKIIIADGSDEYYKKEYNDNVKRFKCVLSIEYFEFCPSLKFIDRCLNVLVNQTEEYIVFGADDDYPNMELMNIGEDFLKKYPDYVSALGARVIFRMEENGSIHQRLDFGRPIDDNQAHRRMKFFSDWTFATTNAITRRTHLIERLKRIRKYPLLKFIDFIIGLHDAAKGKIKAYPDVGFFSTLNSVHSRFRPTSKLSFLYDSKYVLDLQETIKDYERKVRLWPIYIKHLGDLKCHTLS